MSKKKIMSNKVVAKAVEKAKKQQEHIASNLTKPKRTFSTDMDTQMVRPFGPQILKAKLPDKIFDMMLEITDEISESEEKVNWGHALAGQIKDEPVITNELLGEMGLYSWFTNLVKYYVTQNNQINGVQPKMVAPLVEADITSMWIVNQKENEYNPVHHHTNATISCVMYLKIPEYIPRALPYKDNADGSIEFIYTAGGEEYITFNKGCYLTRPEEGQLFMFPSYLLHTVYPFLGEGERRSVSFNAIHRYLDKDKLHREELAQAKQREDSLKSELDELKEQVAKLVKEK